MTNFVPSITQDDCLTALRAFLLAVLPSGTEAFVNQGNRVPEPKAADFVVMTEARRDRLRTTVADWDRTHSTDTTMTYEEGTQLTFQLDVHGSMGSDNSQIISTLWRSSFATEFMRSNGYAVAPLWCDEGNQIPFINGEKQWEDRWIMSLTMQANPVVSTPQDFAATLTLGLIEIDSTYVPNPPVGNGKLDFSNADDSALISVISF